MDCFKKKYTIAFLMCALVLSGGLHAATKQLLTKGVQLTKTTVKNVGPRARKFAAECKADAIKNRVELIKAAGLWGGTSLGWYAGMHHLRDANPLVESHFPIASEDRKAFGISDEIKDVVYVAKKSRIGTPGDKNSGQDRWLTNGKGLWGNITSLFSPETPYVDAQGRLRVSDDITQKLQNGEGVDEFRQKVQEAWARHNTNFDYKTYGECALDTAVLTPLGMLGPVVRRLKMVPGGRLAGIYATPVAVNAGIRVKREEEAKNLHQKLEEKKAAQFARDKQLKVSFDDPTVLPLSNNLTRFQRIAL